MFYFYFVSLYIFFLSANVVGVAHFALFVMTRVENSSMKSEKKT